MSGPVELRHEGGVAILTLARPEVHNACSADLLSAVYDVLRGSGLDGATALVLTGAGRSFCSGGDVAAMREAIAGDADRVLGAMAHDLHSIVMAMRHLPMPVVAAVEGSAIGAGVGLALAADLRVMGESAVFIPGYMAIGASPDAGVSYFLTRALGAARTLRALMFNTPLRAETLAAFGLVEEIVPDGQALSAGLALAKRLTGTAPGSLLAVRRLIDAAPTQSLEAHLDDETREFQGLWNGEDFREGVTAFLERRAPQFNGHREISVERESLPG